MKTYRVTFMLNDDPEFPERNTQPSFAPLYALLEDEDAWDTGIVTAYITDRSSGDSYEVTFEGRAPQVRPCESDAALAFLPHSVCIVGVIPELPASSVEECACTVRHWLQDNKDFTSLHMDVVEPPPHC